MDNYKSSSTAGGGHDEYEKKFKEMLHNMISLVTSKGSTLDAKEITASDFMIPPPDMSIDEAKEMFEGEGLIPG
jgi:hypothetical protein